MNEDQGLAYTVWVGGAQLVDQLGIDEGAIGETAEGWAHAVEDHVSRAGVLVDHLFVSVGQE